MKNKKADIAITLLVILTLVLTSASLFVFFANSRSVTADVIDVGFINKIDAMEERNKFIITEAINDLIIKYYAFAFENSDNAHDAAFYMQNRLNELDLRDSAYEGDVINEFKQGGKFEVVSYGVGKINFLEGKLNEELIEVIYQTSPISGNLVERDGNKIWIWAESEQRDKVILKVEHYPESKFILNISEMGLYDFSTVFNAIEMCKKQNSISNVEECLSKYLILFNVKVIDDQSNFKVVFETKEKFIQNGKISKIQFQLSLT